MKVKACGITRLEDALLAVDAGVWAVGFIFVKDTPRYIMPQKAAQIIKNLPEKVERFGVFADAEISEVIDISGSAGVTKIQLHGEESPGYCSKTGLMAGIEIVKAIRIKDINDLELINRYREYVSYILLDTFARKQRGGTGKAFDWNIAKRAKLYNMPIILAGGLSPGNLDLAYREVNPFALDLSSGLEASKGIKDKEKIKSLKNIIKNNKAGL